MKCKFKRIEDSRILLIWLVIFSIFLGIGGFLLSDYRSALEDVYAANKETIKILESSIKELEEANKEKKLELEKQSVKVVEKKITKETPSVELTIEEKIEASCKKYGVPFDIVLAIARLETGWFKSDAYIYRNNPGGMSINEIPLSYATIDEGVDAMVSNLADNYFDIGLTTPEAIGSKYCPVNPEWSVIVRELMSYA